MHDAPLRTKAARPPGDGEPRSLSPRCEALLDDHALAARGAAVAAVALFAVGDAAVAAVRRGRARGGAEAGAVRRGDRDVARAEVAELRTTLGAVSAVAGERA